MGSVEILNDQFLICSHIITYGNASTPGITEQMREEIETMWNEPEGIIKFEDSLLRVIFKITASYQPVIQPLEIYQNLDPRNNYFRIEEFANGNISFVDGPGCNSGYFKLEIIQNIWIYGKKVFLVLCIPGVHWLIRNFNMIPPNLLE